MKSTATPNTLALIVDRRHNVIRDLTDEGYVIEVDSNDGVELRRNEPQPTTIIVTNTHQHLDRLGLLDDKARGLLPSFPTEPVLATTPDHGTVTILDMRAA